MSSNFSFITFSFSLDCHVGLNGKNIKIMNSNFSLIGKVE